MRRDVRPASRSREGVGRRCVSVRALAELGGTGWPAHFECRDDRGKFRLTCRVENAHFPPESAPSRVTLRLPDDVERISREELMSMLERLTSVR